MAPYIPKSPINLPYKKVMSSLVMLDPIVSESQTQSLFYILEKVEQRRL
jgi:hypothetical protein